MFFPISPKDILEKIKDLSGFVRKFNDIDLNKKILSLEQEIINIARENRRLNEQLELNRTASRLSATMKYDQGKQTYFNEGDIVPFCPKCWENEKKQIHLTLQKWNKGTRFDCKVCNYSHVPENVKIGRRKTRNFFKEG